VADFVAEVGDEKGKGRLGVEGVARYSLYMLLRFSSNSSPPRRPVPSEKITMFLGRVMSPVLVQTIADLAGPDPLPFLLRMLDFTVRIRSASGNLESGHLCGRRRRVLAKRDALNIVIRTCRANNRRRCAVLIQKVSQLDLRTFRGSPSHRS
jgi:hypothetical protein